MVKVSVREAVKHYQVSRPTLMKHIKSGNLTGSKDGQGTWKIDQSELARVYTPRVTNGHAEKSNLTTVNSNETSLLQAKLDAALETIERLEVDKSDWKQQAKSLARLMPPDGAGKIPKRPLWPWITGG